MTNVKVTRFDLTTRTARIRAAEKDHLWLPDEQYGGWPVILLHGAGVSSWSAYASAPNYAHSLLAGVLAYNGVPCVAAWMGGDAMANDTAQTCIDAAHTLLAANGVDATKAHYFGVSMGAGTAVRRAGLQPTKVASLMGVIGLSSILNIYANNVAGLRASVGTAWGVTYPTPLPASADLVGVHAPVINANDIPTRWLYSTGDTVTVPADAVALAAAMGITPEIIGTMDHSEASVAAAMNLGAGQWSDYFAWIKANDERLKR